MKKDIPNHQHPDHQFRIDRRTTYGRIMGRKLATTLCNARSAGRRPVLKTIENALCAEPGPVVWEQQGESVLRRLAIEDPGKLAQIAYSLLPRDVFISVEQRTPGNLDPDEWAILRRVIDLIKVNAKGARVGTGAGDDRERVAG
jgi:hypothetical protein